MKLHILVCKKDLSESPYPTVHKLMERHELPATFEIKFLTDSYPKKDST